jgi:hypothetical protein
LPHQETTRAIEEGLNMAKGQLRSNREKKKPKQDKKPVQPASPFRQPAPKAR